MIGDDGRGAAGRECFMEIYLDANATVQPLDCVVEAVTAAMRESWGNPSSEHATGIAARRILERARDAAASLLPGIEPENVVLTSGGTEASNTILGSAGPNSTLIVSAVEHPATMRPSERARSRGANLIVVPVNSQGQADPDAFAQAFVRSSTPSLYASVQWANGALSDARPEATWVQHGRLRSRDLLDHRRTGGGPRDTRHGYSRRTAPGSSK